MMLWKLLISWPPKRIVMVVEEEATIIKKGMGGELVLDLVFPTSVVFH